MRTWRVILLAVVAVLCGGAVYAAFQESTPEATSLSQYVPQGALLAIESPDFSALIHRWTNSTEQKRWLVSDNYAGFSRSRLFGRLAEAQGQFATAAGLTPDAKFVEQVAGGESVFAWYDIGKLEFLYITRMPAKEAENSPLFELRSKFQERKIGDATFYVRTDDESKRTVAFGARGDYLLLATSEDLIAGTLDLMQKPTDRCLRNESWYASTVAAAARKPGDLRMSLNIEKIVPSPYFRSYWVQQNITEMKQYTTALSDLYLEKNTFREERTLRARDREKMRPTTDLSSVLAYLPADRGMYRAQAQPSTEDVVAQLEDKLLSRMPSTYRDRRIAPVADLTSPMAGTALDLEQLIDEPLAVPQSRSAALARLTDTIDGAHPHAMFVFSSATDSRAQESSRVFFPIHSAVVLDSDQNWDAAALKNVISTALRQNLSIAGQGLTWTSQHEGQVSWDELDGIYKLSLVVEGNICIVASDSATLRELLQASKNSANTKRVATVIGGFNQGSERAAFVRLSRLLDHSGAGEPQSGDQPPFFSGNIGSLSNTFSDLKAESFTESSAPGGITRQTTIYRWR